MGLFALVCLLFFFCLLGYLWIRDIEDKLARLERELAQERPAVPEDVYLEYLNDRIQETYTRHREAVERQDLYAEGFGAGLIQGFREAREKVRQLQGPPPNL